MATASPTRSRALWALMTLGHLGLALVFAVALRPGVALGYLGLVAAWAVFKRRHRLFKRLPRRTLQFTREGKALVAITLGIGLGAVNTGNNLLYLMLGMLLSMIIVSGILSEQTLRKLSVVRDLPGEAYAGAPFLTRITLTNGKGRLPSYSVQIEDVVDGRPAAKKCYFLKVPAGARQQTSYRGEFPRRGRYTYEALRVGTRFPFGFFVKRREATAPGELVVYPAVRPVRAPPVVARDLLGQARRPKRGAGREFHGLRDWRTGEDARDIHWTRSAKTGRLVKREFEQDGARHVGLWLADHMHPGRPIDLPAQDRLVEQAASLMAHYHRLGFEVDVAWAGRTVQVRPDGRGRRQALRMLALAHFDAPPPAEPPALPKGPAWIAVAPPGATSALGPQRFVHVVEAG